MQTWLLSFSGPVLKNQKGRRISPAASGVLVAFQLVSWLLPKVAGT